jgi:hypothetical protein
MIYLASPYTHLDTRIMEQRYQDTLDYMEYLMSRKRWAFSPIVHCHELAKKHYLPTDYSYWKQYNFHMLTRCDELYVLGIEGWRASKGVRAELEFWDAFKHQGTVLWIQGTQRTGLTYETPLLIEMLDIEETPNAASSRVS